MTNLIDKVKKGIVIGAITAGSILGLNSNEAYAQNPEFKQSQEVKVQDPNGGTKDAQVLSIHGINYFEVKDTTKKELEKPDKGFLLPWFDFDYDIPSLSFIGHPKDTTKKEDEKPDKGLDYLFPAPSLSILFGKDTIYLKDTMDLRGYDKSPKTKTLELDPYKSPKIGSYKLKIDYPTDRKKIEEY